LILRGVAFEFHEHANHKLPWNLSIGIGSLLAAACQGLAVHNKLFVGGILDWFTPFSVLVAVGVVTGYTLLGATYLIMKTAGDFQQSYKIWARLSAWLLLPRLPG
jgi:cytochrome d ubiquinol oxidase subunit II